MSNLNISDPEFIDLQKTKVRFKMLVGQNRVVAELTVPPNQEKGVNPHWDYILENFDVEAMRQRRNAQEIKRRKFDEFQKKKIEAKKENDALVDLFNKKMSLFEMPFVSEASDDVKSAIRRSSDGFFLDFIYYNMLNKIMLDNNYNYLELLEYLEQLKEEKSEGE